MRRWIVPALVAAAAVCKAEPPRTTPVEAVMVSPFLRNALKAHSLSLEVLEERLADLDAQSRQLAVEQPRASRSGELADERWALQSLIESIRDLHRWSADAIPGWVDEFDGKIADLPRMRAQNRMANDLMALTSFALLTSDTALEQKLVLALDRLIEKHGDPAALISTTGNSWEGFDFSGPDDPRQNNYRARDAALWLGLRYTLTGKQADAEKVRDLLRRFAEVMPGWQLYTRDNVPYPQRGGAGIAAFLAAKDGDNGLWGTWYPLEMRACFPLVQAFALTRRGMTEEEQEQILTQLFEPFYTRTAQFPFAPHHNLFVYHLEGLMLWGRALQEPRWVHLAVHGYEEHLQRGFSPDGFWKELTPDYHRQVLMPMLYRLPAYVEGYSDPASYRDPETGERFDQLDLRQRNEAALEHAFEAWTKTLLPDNRAAALTDSEANEEQNFVQPIRDSRSRLLGTSGLAVLASGRDRERNELFLLYKGTHGHQHEDPLAILWYAHGLEVLSETTYRGPVASRELRPWYQSAAAHLTLIVDEKAPFSQLNHFRVPEEHLRWPEASGKLNNQGTLLVYDPALPEAQFVQAEHTRAYAPAVRRYQRTLVTLPLANGDACLVDLFEVEGGQQHDLMLHAGLNEPYTAEVSGGATLKGHPANQTVYEKIALSRRFPISEPASVLFRHQHGVNLSARLLSPTGPQTSLLLGEGPAIRRDGSAPYLIWRQNGSGHTGRTLFATVYTAYRDADPLTQARAIAIPGKPGAMVIELTFPDRVDAILLNSGADPELTWNGLHFRGHLGYVQWREGKPVIAHLSKGERLTSEGHFDLTQPPEQSGTLAAQQPEDRRTLRLDQEIAGETPGSLVHLDFGPMIRWSYPILKSKGAELEIAHDRGFELGGSGFEMDRFPGWQGKHPVRWTLPRQATWRAMPITSSPSSPTP